MPRSSSIEREIEEMLHQGSQHMESRIILAGIPEKEDAILPYPAIQPMEKEQVSDELNVSKSVMNVTAAGVMDQEDITDLPTQKLETLSTRAKRASDSDRAAKKQRVDDISLPANRKSQELVNDADQMDAGEKRKTIAVPDIQVSKLDQTIAPWKEHTPNENVTTMLQKAGLVDLLPEINSAVSISSERSRRERSSGSVSSTETQLGSLDRTEVSVGDSVDTSDSELFERSEHSRRERRSDSDNGSSTEALPGSLDRTEVSVGDSVDTSDSEPFERSEHSRRERSSYSDSGSSTEALPGSLDRTEVSVGDTVDTSDFELFERSEHSRRERSSGSGSNTEAQPGSLDRTEVYVVESVDTSDSELFERSEHSRRERCSDSDSRSSTEALPGSLDRTDVSVGETVETSDSELFERLEWGTKDTIRKIVSLLQDTKTIKFEDLIGIGSGIDGPSKIKVSRCFMSLLSMCGSY